MKEPVNHDLAVAIKAIVAAKVSYWLAMILHLGIQWTGVLY